MNKKWSNLKFWETETGKLCANLDGLPRIENRYRAFDLTPPHKVKVVILGQDPYPTQGVADGLAFSTWPHIKKTPASLRKIFEEYASDLGFPKPRTNSLETWAKRGVLLLNTCLSVEPGRPYSHCKLGWEKLTLEVFKELRSRQGIVYCLWGNHAKAYSKRVDTDKNLLLTCGHPSPLNIRGTFQGCKHFSQACEYMNEPYEFWRLP